MKNLIKKILKESEDDGLDWIRDIKPTLTRNELRPGDEFSFKYSTRDNDYWVDAIFLGKITYPDRSSNYLCNLVDGHSAPISGWGVNALDDDEQDICFDCIINPDELYFFETEDDNSTEFVDIDFPTSDVRFTGIIR